MSAFGRVLNTFAEVLNNNKLMGLFLVNGRHFFPGMENGFDGCILHRENQLRQQSLFFVNHC